MKFYCGIDLSARDSHVCVVNQQLSRLVDEKVPNKLPRIIALLEIQFVDVVWVDLIFGFLRWRRERRLCAWEGKAMTRMMDNTDKVTDTVFMHWLDIRKLGLFRLTFDMSGWPKASPLDGRVSFHR